MASYGVVINPDGEVETFVKLENFLKRLNSFHEKEKLAKVNDMKKLKEFIQVTFH